LTLLGGYNALERVQLVIITLMPEAEEDVRTALAWAKAPAIDSVVSFASVIIFASGFMIGGARLLHSEQLVPAGLKLLEYQA